MKIERIDIKSIKISDDFSGVYPCRSEEAGRITELTDNRLMICVDEQDNLISGLDFLEYFKREGYEAVEVVVRQREEKDFISDFNMRAMLFELNLWEKLIFIKRALNSLSVREIKEKTLNDININEELLVKIDLLCTDEFREILAQNRISLKAALFMTYFKGEDLSFLINIFNTVKMSFSASLEFLEIVQELCFREKLSASSLFDSLGISDSDDFTSLIQKLRCSRFPGLTRYREEWEARVRSFNLPHTVKLQPSRNFSEKSFSCTVLFNDLEESADQVKRIADIVR